MIQTRLNLLALLHQSGFFRQAEPISHLFPRQVAQGDELRLSVPSCHSPFTIPFRRQFLTIHQDISIIAVQIINISQIRKFFIFQQPRIGIDLRSQYQIAVESLQHQIIFPIIQTRRQTNTMIFRQARQSVRRFSGQSPSPVMRRRHFIGHKHIYIRLLATQQESS